MLDLKYVVDSLNKVIKLFRENATKNNLALENWTLEVDDPTWWHFDYVEPFQIIHKLPTRVYIDKPNIEVGFNIYRNYRNPDAITYWVHFLKLLDDIVRPLEFSKQLIELFAKHYPVSLERVKQVFDSFYLKNSEEIMQAVSAWMEFSDYQSSGDYGRELYKYKSYIPDRFKKSPSDTLYRAVAVDENLFYQIQTGNRKSLKLRNRTYSSWSYDLNQVKKFAKSHTQIGKISVIFCKKFSKSQIFLDITTFAQFLEIKSYLWNEKEIIVRNALRDFTFTPQDIYLYLDKDYYYWQPFRVLRKR